MESSSSSLESILEAVKLRSAGVGNLYLAGGFLMVTSLLGLLVIIGVFWYHRNNLSLFKRSCVMSFCCQGNVFGVQVIHNSLVFLLLMDAVNLIVGIIFGAEIVRLSCYEGINCTYVEIVWFLSRWFGVFLHLLNASLSINQLSHQPLSATRVRIAYSLISVLIVLVVLLYLYVTKAGIFTLAAFMFLFALSVIVTCRVPTSSPSTDTRKKLIVVVAMLNFLVVFVPTFIVQCLLFSSHDENELMNYEIIYGDVLVFTNLHLIFDGFQCALLLKLPSGEEQQQQLGFSNPGYTTSTNVNQ